MIYMTAEQAKDFFGDAEVPSHVVIETEKEMGARIGALLAA